MQAISKVLKSNKDQKPSKQIVNGGEFKQPIAKKTKTPRKNPGVFCYTW